MSYSEAAKRATIKYIKNNYDTITIRKSKGTKERWKKAADTIGEPLHEFISRSVTERLKNYYPDVYKELHFDVE